MSLYRAKLAAIVLLGGLVFGRMVGAQEPQAEEPAPYAGLAVMLDLLITAAEPEASGKDKNATIIQL